MIHFTCACGKRLTAPAAAAGQTISCPGCGKPALVPATVAAGPGTLTGTLPTEALPSQPPPAGDPPTDPATCDLNATVAPAEPASRGNRARTECEPATNPQTGHKLGGYRIRRQLGQGGMGIVYEAEDVKLQRRVSLKMMKPESASHPEQRERFLREARSAAQVDSMYICPVYEVGEVDGVPFIAMPLLEGESLNQHWKKGQRLPVEEVVRIGKGVAEGLSAAHEAGLVHRDIKPANIWLERQPAGPPRPVILDFGLARVQDHSCQITQSGVIVGTPAFMSPEQARGDKNLDARTDLFSLGCVLYALATGKLPFKGKQMMDVLLALATQEPVPPRTLVPSMPRPISDLILRMLAKHPDARPATARAVADELAAIERGFADASGVVARRAPAARRPRTGERRGASAPVQPETAKAGAASVRARRAPCAVLTVVLIAVVGFLGVLVGGGLYLVLRQRGVENAANPALVPLEKVRSELQQRNPDFDGVLTHGLSGRAVVSLKLNTDAVADITPVRQLTQLHTLELRGSGDRRGSLADLTPLAGLKLASLALDYNPVLDLTPLRGMSLQTLHLQGTQVADLTPLTGMPLETLDVRGTRVTNLQPLVGLPLRALSCDFDPRRDTRFLLRIKTLATVNEMPADRFWPEVVFRPRLAAMRRGQDQPADNVERVAFARYATEQAHYAFAAGLWADALAADPKLGEDRAAQHRYHAARAAVLAAAGQGKDEPALDAAASAKLRSQALDWLKAELPLMRDRADTARIVAAAAPLPGLPEKLAEAAPDDTLFQAELAAHFTATGKGPAAAAARARARTRLEAKRAEQPDDAGVVAELADLLLDVVQYESTGGVQWTVLRPIELKSRGGATLTLQADGSILAGGPNPPRDDYTIVARPALQRITAIRLEALPDPSLPNNGPGREENGNFHLNRLRVFSGDQPARLTDIAVRYSELVEFPNVIVAGRDNNRGWSNGGRPGEKNIAVIATDLQRDRNDDLKVEFWFSRSQWTEHNLGRFRLSVSGEPAAFDRGQQCVTITQLADPRSRLAAAYALVGEYDRAVAYFGRALAHADGYDARRPILEAAARFDKVIAALAKTRAEDPQTQMVLARSLLERGKHFLADQQPAKAQAVLEAARDRFRQLPKGEHRTVLKPVQMNTDTRARMVLQADGSIFVQQPKDAATDGYTLVFESRDPNICGLRLETLADDRLPHRGPGWYPATGAFALGELGLTVAPVDHPEQDRTIRLHNPSADLREWRVDRRERTNDIGRVIDDNPRTVWLFGNGFSDGSHRNPTAVFDLTQAVGTGQPLRLTVRLDQHHPYSGCCLLGRFRLAFTTDRATLQATRLQFDLQHGEEAEVHETLGKAQAQQGRTKQAVESFATALGLARNVATRNRIIASGAPLQGVLEPLAETTAGEPLSQAALVSYFASHDRKPLAEAIRKRARALLEQQLAVEPDNGAVAAGLAELLESGRGPADHVWIDDAPPPGARMKKHIAQTDVETPWEFVGAPLHPVFRGKKSLRCQGPEIGQLLFEDGPVGLRLGDGARLFAHVYLDPRDPPRTVMLQFWDGSWEHRAFWGEDVIPWGAAGTPSRLRMGPLPRAGEWVRLEVDAARLGLLPGTVLAGWAFTQYGGTCYWDAAGTTRLGFETPWQALAAAYDRLGEPAALQQAVLARHPSAAAGIGDLHAVSQDWDRVFAAYHRACRAEPTDTALARRVFRIAYATRRIRDQVEPLAALATTDPSNNVLWLNLAAGQAWVGREKEYAATRKRILALAKDTRDWITAERAAKSCSILPSADRAELQAVLALARRATELDGADVYATLSLGVAAYRIGDDALAEKMLLDVAKMGPAAATVPSRYPGQGEHLTAIAGLYRAMILHRQGKRDEARALLIASVVPMKPPPADPDHLPSDMHHNDLFIWLAFKEARTVLGIEQSFIELLIEARSKQVQTLDANHATTLVTTQKIVAALASAGRTREAVPYLAAMSAAAPKDTLLFMKVAALAAWFGQDQELAATRRWILSLAKDNGVPDEVNEIARACSVAPSTDKTELASVLRFARAAAQRGRNGPNAGWVLMSLGMAEYRSGNDAAAEEALRAAAKLGPSHVTDTSAFYRAMSLFRQGKQDEARKLARAAAVRMKPLPADENNPLAGTAMDHDDLILWLAYREARALIGFDGPPAPDSRSS